MTQPLLLIVSAMTSPFSTLASEYGLVFHHELVGFITRVVETQPILVLMDSTYPNWQGFSEALKSSNATRRFPTLLLSDDADVRASSPLHGVDEAIAMSDFSKDPLKFVHEYAKLPDAALLEQLDCDCLEALPTRGLEGVAKFNAREYYAQHDLFEAQWMAETRPVRDLYRAILQVGVGYYQIERGNYRGALKTLQKSVQWLMLLPDVCQGVDIKRLREESFAVRAELQRLGEAHFDEFDKSLLKALQMV